MYHRLHLHLPTRRLKLNAEWLSLGHLPTGSLPAIKPRPIGAGFGVSAIMSELRINSAPDLARDELLAFPAFKTWLSTLQKSLARQSNPAHEFHGDPYVLRQIDVQAVDRFGGGRLGFVKLKADVSNSQGEKLPGSVFLRGGSVGMLVCFIFYSCLHSFRTRSLTIMLLAHPATGRHSLVRGEGEMGYSNYPASHTSWISRIRRNPSRYAR